MKKQKVLKQWVFEKKKSITEKLGSSKLEQQEKNSEQQSKEKKGKMDVDTLVHPHSGVPSNKTSFTVKGNIFRVDARYSYIKTLGFGAYGVVCSADDLKTGKKVALKKVAGVFDDLTDAKRIIREIRLLRSMKHDSVLKVINIDEPEDYNAFNDVYIVTELMDTDLNKLIRQSTKLLNSQRKYFAYHILRALKYIHSFNIFHRDLKPANILVSASCDIKICDFGLARYVNPDPIEGQAQNMTEYVVTRWYRAPELLLSTEDYSAAIDMWSAGCILAELYHGRPLFPGSDVKDQLDQICKKLGKPSSEEIEMTPNLRARAFMQKRPEWPKQDFRVLMKGHASGKPEEEIDDSAIDLIERLLKFDPKKRLTAAQALEHPYVQEYRDKKMETVAEPIDNEKLEPPSETIVGRDGVRRLMWNEMLYFHPDAESREPAAAKEAQKNLNKNSKKLNP